MTYKNSLQNLNKLINSNEIIVTDKKIDNNTIETNMIVSSSSEYLFTKIKNFGTDWKLMTTNAYLATRNKAYANWSVSFLKIDYRLLPCININIVCKNGVNGSINENVDYWSDGMLRGYYFVTEDIKNETYMKKVTLHAYLFITTESSMANYAKFLIQFINPNKYV